VIATSIYFFSRASAFGKLLAVGGNGSSRRRRAAAVCVRAWPMRWASALCPLPLCPLYHSALCCVISS
jgi:hypothetical protein